MIADDERNNNAELFQSNLRKLELLTGEKQSFYENEIRSFSRKNNRLSLSDMEEKSRIENEITSAFQSHKLSARVHRFCKQMSPKQS